METSIIFGGIGHWQLVLQKLGYEPKYNYSAGAPYDDIYELNYKNLVKDINETKYADLIVGSPPCIGVSSANCHNCGETNKNNTGMIAFSERIKALQPRMFVMEMVTGLKKYPILYKTITDNFKDYNMQVFEVDAANYKGYQHRKRLFFVGSLNPKTFFTLPPEYKGNILPQLFTRHDTISDGEPPAGRKGPYSHWLHKEGRDIKKRLKSFTITGYCTKDIFYDNKFLKFEVAADIMGFPRSYKYTKESIKPRMISHGVDIRSVSYLLENWIRNDRS